MCGSAAYTIVEDSWDVIGLSGTGSRDIVVDDAFIPSYRAVRFEDVESGAAAAGAAARTHLTSAARYWGHKWDFGT